MRNIFFLLCAAFLLTHPLVAGDRVEDAAAYVCQVAKAKQMPSVAVFSFTDGTGAVTPDSTTTTQKVIARIVGCEGLTVIDQNRISKVLEQQAAAQSGLFDPETSPEIGHLVGAKTLLYGNADEKSLQLSLVDAETGAVEGAVVEDSKPTEQPKIHRVEGSEAREGFNSQKLHRQLMFLHNRQPMLFLYVVTSEAETQAMKSENPKRYERFQTMLDRALAKVSGDQRKNLAELRTRTLALRSQRPALDRRIQSLREQIMEKHRRL